MVEFSFANVQILGNIGFVEIKEVGAKKVIKASIAVNSKKKVEGEWVESTSWYNCEYWIPEGSSYAETAFVKGQKIFVSGKLIIENYEKDGANKLATKVKVNSYSPITDIKPSGTSIEAPTSQNNIQHKEELPF